MCESRRNELADNTLHHIEFHYLMENKIFNLKFEMSSLVANKDNWSIILKQEIVLQNYLGFS